MEIKVEVDTPKDPDRCESIFDEFNEPWQCFFIEMESPFCNYYRFQLNQDKDGNCLKIEKCKTENNQH